MRAQGGLSNREFSVRMRDLWIVKGFTKHGLNTKKLKQVASRYWKLGVVPQDYNQADFYSSPKKPAFYSNIEEKKQKWQNYRILHNFILGGDDVEGRQLYDNQN